MKTQDHDTVQTAPVVAIMGDERLTDEFAALLASHAIETIPANDERAIKAASARIRAGVELTVLSADQKKARVQFLDAHLPIDAPLITSSVTVTALAQSQWTMHPERLVGFSGFPTLLDAPLVDLAATHRTSAECLTNVREFFAALGKDTVCVQDRTGMIVPAMASQIVNEALMAVQQNVASARDIDTAMKLGAGYALGPIEWGEKIGFAYVLAVLEAMRLETGEARFRTGALLRQLAAAGTFWHEPVEAAPAQEELALGEAVVLPLPAHDDAGEEPKKKRARKRSAGA